MIELVIMIIIFAIVMALIVKYDQPDLTVYKEDVRSVELIKEEIADLAEIIKSGDDLVVQHPMDIGMVISQTGLYNRMERLEIELGMAREVK
jgi:hypothetical protein